jgi:DNA-binding transcriptional LysR family regulator
VLPELPRFLATYPDLQLHLGEGDRLVDLVREGIDCVLRVGDLAESGMVARRVAMLDEVTVASPAYLARHGTPAAPDDLAGHLAVSFISSATGAAIPFELVVDGSVRNVPMRATVTVSAAETLIAAARLGLGLIQAPRYHLERDIAAGTLVPVLEACAPTPSPVSLLYLHSRQLSPRVRVFIDWVAGLFAMRAPART